MLTKSIRFKKLGIEGFRSYKEYIEFDFSDKGLFVLNGHNGSGKTSLIEAPYWCLTGDNLKGSLQDELINEECQYCVVGLFIEVDGVDFLISRSIGSESLLKVYENGTLIGALHKKDSQEYIDRLLSVSKVTLLNTLVFGQRMKRLVETTASEQRELFEEMFNIGFVDAARSNAKDLKAGLNDEKTELENKTAISENKVKICLNLIEQNAADINNFKQRKEARIKDLEESIKEWTVKSESEKLIHLKMVKEPLGDIGELTKKFDETNEAIVTVNQELAVIESKVKSKKSEIDSFKDNISGECPTCFSEIDSKVYQTTVKRRVADINKQITKLNKQSTNERNKLNELVTQRDKIAKEIKSYRESLAKYNEDMNENRLAEQHNNMMLKSRENILQVIKEKHKELGDIIADEGPEDLRESYMEEMGAANIELAELKLKLDNYDKLINGFNWWVNTGFGPNGLKAYIFKYMLGQLNANIVKYSSRLGLSINFTVDVSGKTKRFETVCKMQDGTIRKYSSLSGGEKTRVDISIAFGMFDLLKSSKVSFNVLLLDEVFENLDLEGVEEAFEIIRVLAEDSAVYLVTFNMVDSLGVKTYTFDKTDGTTKIH